MDDPKAVGRDPSAKRKVAIRPYGSPIFNQEGKLVAVYGDTTLPQGDELLLLHYAAVVNPKLIGRWIGGEANQKEDVETWLLPDVFSPPPEPARKPCKRRPAQQPDRRTARDGHRSGHDLFRRGLS